jgi:hypothetical protein
MLARYFMRVLIIFAIVITFSIGIRYIRIESSNAQLMARIHKEITGPSDQCCLVRNVTSVIGLPREAVVTYPPTLVCDPAQVTELDPYPMISLHYVSGLCSLHVHVNPMDKTVRAHSREPLGDAPGEYDVGWIEEGRYSCVADKNGIRLLKKSTEDKGWILVPYDAEIAGASHINGGQRLFGWFHRMGTINYAHP